MRTIFCNRVVIKILLYIGMNILHFCIPRDIAVYREIRIFAARGFGGPEICGTSRITHIIESWPTDGSEFASLKSQPHPLLVVISVRDR
jgi:hypothetical protein